MNPKLNSRYMKVKHGTLPTRNRSGYEPLRFPTWIWVDHFNTRCQAVTHLRSEGIVQSELTEYSMESFSLKANQEVPRVPRKETHPKDFAPKE